MSEETEELKKAKKLLGVQTDKELAEILGISVQAVNSYRLRGISSKLKLLIQERIKNPIQHEEITPLTFKELRMQLGLTQVELALKLGVSRWQIINCEKGHAPIKTSITKKMMALAQDANITTNASTNTTTSYSVPLLSIAASAGYGSMGFKVVTDGEFLLDVNIFKTPQKQENLRALRVEGDSMNPTLCDGDYVVIDMKKKSSDGIYVLRRSNEFFVKRLQFDIITGNILIISDNKAYETKSIDAQAQEEFDILGRVVAMIKAV